MFLKIRVRMEELEEADEQEDMKNEESLGDEALPQKRGVQIAEYIYREKVINKIQKIIEEGML